MALAACVYEFWIYGGTAVMKMISCFNTKGRARLLCSIQCYELEIVLYRSDDLPQVMQQILTLMSIIRSL